VFFAENVILKPYIFLFIKMQLGGNPQIFGPYSGQNLGSARLGGTVKVVSKEVRKIKFYLSLQASLSSTSDTPPS
jgi:hypothetical protein